MASERTPCSRWFHTHPRRGAAPPGVMPTSVPCAFAIESSTDGSSRWASPGGVDTTSISRSVSDSSTRRASASAISPSTGASTRCARNSPPTIPRAVQAP